jgi:hypothetical protein
MAKGNLDSVQRWTAKRRVALVLTIVKGGDFGPGGCPQARPHCWRDRNSTIRTRMLPISNVRQSATPDVPWCSVTGTQLQSTVLNGTDSILNAALLYPRRSRHRTSVKRSGLAAGRAADRLLQQVVMCHESSAPGSHVLGPGLNEPLDGG